MPRCSSPLLLRFYGRRNCPGVSLSTDITSGWGPEVMLLNSPPPAPTLSKCTSTAPPDRLGTLTVHLHCTPFPLTFVPENPVQSSRFTARRQSRSSFAPPPTALCKVLTPLHTPSLCCLIFHVLQVNSGTFSPSLWRQTAALRWEARLSLPTASPPAWPTRTSASPTAGPTAAAWRCAATCASHSALL